jgi:hypothetical protein
VRTAVVLVAGGCLLALSLSACSSGSKSTADGPATTNSAKTTAAVKAAAGHSTSRKGPAAGSGSGSGGVDVCSLLSSAQASSINKVTYGATKPLHIQSGYDQCTYTNTGKHASPVDIQNLTVQVISVPDCYGHLKSAEGPGKPVAGVGDAAFGYGIGIIVQAGDRCVEVQGLTGAELQGNYASDAAMAKIIISGLH